MIGQKSGKDGNLAIGPSEEEHTVMIINLVDSDVNVASRRHLAAGFLNTILAIAICTGKCCHASIQVLRSTIFTKAWPGFSLVFVWAAACFSVRVCLSVRNRDPKRRHLWRVIYENERMVCFLTQVNG
ncbi:hypothetical protein V8F06_007041 [Rhypophila decipiens]